MSAGSPLPMGAPDVALTLLACVSSDPPARLISDTVTRNHTKERVTLHRLVSALWQFFFSSSLLAFWFPLTASAVHCYRHR